MKELNFSTLDCPGPVIETKKYLESTPETTEITVIVGNDAASQNVLRFLTTMGFEGNIAKDGDIFKVTGTRGETGKVPEKSPESVKETQEDSLSTLIMFTNKTLGTGSLELGGKLMVNFIKTLSEMNNLWRLVFVNEAVKLTVGDAETIKPLQELEASGVSILVCGTCLEYFDILKDKKVGETTNMLDIVTSLDVADKVINY